MRTSACQSIHRMHAWCVQRGGGSAILPSLCVRVCNTRPEFPRQKSVSNHLAPLNVTILYLEVSRKDLVPRFSSGISHSRPIPN